jgi:putative copper resistance protein D
MSALGLVVRPIHFIGNMVLFGEFLFAIWITAPSFFKRPDAARTRQLQLHRSMLLISTWSFVAIFLSGMIWLAMEAILMSGLDFKHALTWDVLSTVLNETQFGRIWQIRFGLVIALAILLAVLRVKSNSMGRTTLHAIGLLLGGALLAALAWTGHATAERGINHDIHLLADTGHLLGAGAWFGALLPLILVLAHAQRTKSPEDIEFATFAARRFSTIGIVSMTVLVFGGITNAWYTVGSIDALFETDYGKLLFAKLVLFAVILVLAATNRLRLTPHLPLLTAEAYTPSSQAALRLLCRNALIEFLLGLAIITIAGQLGVSIPSIHMHHQHEIAHMHMH